MKKWYFAKFVYMREFNQVTQIKDSILEKVHKTDDWE